MKRLLPKLKLSLITVLILVSVAMAGVPGAINYQGYLKDSAGVPVSTATSIRFSLYSSNPPRSNPVWTETKSVAPSNGIYSTQLGSVMPITAPFDVPYWLGVKVAGDAEMALQPLASAPYALTAGGIGPGSLTLNSDVATNKALIVKGATGQTANLQEWQNSSGAAMASVSSVGDLTITGNLNLPATTATTGIIRSGGSRLLHSPGTTSFFSGINAGNLTTSGTWNTGTGYDALMSISSGNNNTAIGAQALVLNSTGNANTAIGAAALQNNSIGTVNSAMGLNSLNKNTSGSRNVAYGTAALFANTTANNNSAFGNGALFENTTGTNNTAIGYQAGYTLTIANANTTGNNNTFIGAYSGPGTTTQLTNATAIGYNALVSQNNSLVLGGTGLDAVKVGIGTQIPSEVLDVVGNVRINNKDIYLRTDADTNHGLGWFGAGKLFAGSSLDGPALYGFSGGALGTTGSGQKIALAWNSSGNIGIGTATPSERLDVAGTVKATAFSGNGVALSGLNAGSISTGTLAIAQGGTGATSAPAALSSLGAATASHNHDIDYQQKYGKTAVVARRGGDFENPLPAMTEALADWCGTPSATNPCLLKIMPGVYNIGTSSLVMQPYVDIEGSGESVTKISGTIDSDVAGIVVGASHAEIRYLTVENTGSANNISIAIFNRNASPKISHVTAKATASYFSEAVHNETSSPTMLNVSLTTSSMGDCRGIMNIDSTSTITNVSITNDPACTGYGIHNRRISATTSAQVSNLHAIFSGVAPHSYGIYNNGGTVGIQDSHIAAIDNPYDQVVAIYNRSGTVRVANSILEGWVDDIKAIPGVIYEGVRIPPNVIYSDGIYRLFGSSTVQVGAASGSGLVIESHDMNSNLQEWKGPGNYLLASMSPWGVLKLPTDGLSVGWDGNSIYGQFVLAAGKVGIGKSAPTEVLDVLGNIRINDRDVLFRQDTDALHGVGFYGGTKTFAGTDVNGPVLYGNGGGALGSINGAQQIALSWNSSNNISMSGALITQGDITTQSNLTVNSIPTGTSSYVLCSSLANRGTLQRCSASSRKLKENIADLSLGLGTVSKLRPVSFTWKANSNRDFGFIAEEVAELDPMLAIYNEQGEPDGVKYANMSAVLVKAAQEQQLQIEQQKAKIDAQGAMIEELKTELAALKAMMSR